MLTSTPRLQGRKRSSPRRAASNSAKVCELFRHAPENREDVQRVPVGGDGDNLPVRQADGLARQVDFDELLALLHQPNRPGKHVDRAGRRCKASPDNQTGEPETHRTHIPLKRSGRRSGSVRSACAHAARPRCRSCPPCRYPENERVVPGVKPLRKASPPSKQATLAPSGTRTSRSCRSSSRVCAWSSTMAMRMFMANTLPPQVTIDSVYHKRPRAARNFGANAYCSCRKTSFVQKRLHESR